MDFQYFGFSDPVAEGIRRMGFSEPTRIQAEVVPHLLSGRDVLAKAETGSGKTLAYAAPLVEKIDTSRPVFQALVLTPSRDLALSIVHDVESLGATKNVKVAMLVAGEHIRTQKKRLPGRHAIIGTPGRIADLIESRLLGVEWVRYVVIDEFDRQLEENALVDIRRVLGAIAAERQTVVFSQTMSRDASNIAKSLMKRAEIVDDSAQAQAALIAKQRCVRTKSARKMAVLERILKDGDEGDETYLVFCNTKQEVRTVDRDLWVKELSVASLADDLEESARWKVIDRFRRREIRILLTSDLSKDGLDIDHVSHVVNFDVPHDTDEYLDRVKRAGRSGRRGLVTTLIGDEEVNAFQRIKKVVAEPIDLLTEALGPTARHEEAPAAPAPVSEPTPVAEAAPVPNRVPDESDYDDSDVDEVDDDIDEIDDIDTTGDTNGADAERDRDDDGAADGGDPRSRRGRRRRGRRGGRVGRDGAPVNEGRTDVRPRDPGVRSPAMPDVVASGDDRAPRRDDRPNDRHQDRNDRGGRNGDRNARDPRRDDGRGQNGRPAPDRTNEPAREGEAARTQNDGHRPAPNERDPRQNRGDRPREGGARNDKNDRNPRNGHRSRFDYKKWEEEQLNRPVELIEDRWSDAANDDDDAPRFEVEDADVAPNAGNEPARDGKPREGSNDRKNDRAPNDRGRQGNGSGRQNQGQNQQRRGPGGGGGDGRQGRRGDNRSNNGRRQGGGNRGPDQNRRPDNRRPQNPDARRPDRRDDGGAAR